MSSRRLRAISSRAGTGSRREIVPKQRYRAGFRFDLTGNRSRWYRPISGICCAALAAWVVLLYTGTPTQSRSRRVTLDARAANITAKVNNAADLKIELMPEPDIKIGKKILIKASTKKPGYLILMDVDAAGKVTQIYPNIHSMTIPRGAAENTNFLQSGTTVSIPDPSNAFAHFEYVAEPPPGEGMIVALLSPKPVHVVDLPDVPQDLVGSQSAMDFLYDAARALRIAPHDANAPLADPQWSFAAVPYKIEN